MVQGQRKRSDSVGCSLRRIQAATARELSSRFIVGQFVAESSGIMLQQMSQGAHLAENASVKAQEGLWAFCFEPTLLLFVICVSGVVLPDTASNAT